MKHKVYLIGSLLIIFILGFTLHKPHNDLDETAPIEQDSLEILYNPADEISALLTPFDSIVEQNFEASGTIGAAVVITYKGQVVLTKCFGVRKKGETDSIDAHTIFRLASVSKSVTGVLAGIMDDEDIVNFDDRVIDFLPEFQLKNPDYTQQLTVKNLLSQTSGIVPHAYDLMVEDKVPLDKIIARLDEAALTAAPGEIYTYQNVVYSMYEPIIEAKTQKSFKDLMTEKIFMPFGMNDASLTFESFMDETNKAYPHTRVGTRRYSNIPLNDRYYNTAPAAGVNASISDMGQLLQALSGHHTELVSVDANKNIFTPLINTPVKRKYFRNWGQDISDICYGIGWRIVNYRGRSVAYHGGYVKGYKAEIALCNNDDIGIAVLSNSPNSSSSKCIPTFLDMYFDHSDFVLVEEKVQTTNNEIEATNTVL